MNIISLLTTAAIFLIAFSSGAQMPPLREAKTASLSEAQKQGREKVIANCEKIYKEVQEAKKSVVPLTDPGFFSLPATKKKYEENKLQMRILDKEFNNLTNHANKKIQVRMATSPAKLEEEINAYSHYCLQSANALKGFIDFIKKGTSGNTEKDKQYQGWINLEKCGKYTC